MSGAQTVTVTGKKLADDDVSLVVGERAWAGWSDIRITRGMERMPNDFQIALTEIYPDDASKIDIPPGAECEVWIGKNRVITGYVDRYVPAMSVQQHSVTITGRGRGQDLVDCSAEWPGQQIVASSVIEVARKLAAPFKISVDGVTGPSVGKGKDSPLIPVLNLMLGETAWEIIERLCRIGGILAYEEPDGSLRLVEDPGTLFRRRDVTVPACSGFAEGVNVQSAQAVFSMDQRFSRYRTFVYSFDPLKELRLDPDPIATASDASVTRYRPRDIIAEMGHYLSYENATNRCEWEAARRWGRSRVVHLTTDSWRDASGMLYAPMMLAPLNLPTLKVDNVLWVIGEVTYRKAAGGGTECDLTLMHPTGYAVQPTLPAGSLPWEIATQARNAGAP